jgi:hypothetical protein
MALPIEERTETGNREAKASEADLAYDKDKDNA